MFPLFILFIFDHLSGYQRRRRRRRIRCISIGIRDIHLCPLCCGQKGCRIALSFFRKSEYDRFHHEIKTKTCSSRRYSTPSMSLYTFYRWDWADLPRFTLPFPTIIPSISTSRLNAPPLSLSMPALSRKALALSTTLTPLPLPILPGADLGKSDSKASSDLQSR